MRGNWIAIIQGHDIYSVGLQECLDLERVREAIWAHLGGPEEYKMFCTEIGSDNTNLGYHGFIALTVFVRKSDWDAGSVRKTTTATKEKSTGQNLIITTAQNKGAVGIPFQIHDTSVAFVTSHLPSDQKGKSKLAKRNDAAAAILKEVVLASQDVHCDMHLLHDHVFFTGDLNYRINPTLLPPSMPLPGESLQMALLRGNKLTAPIVSSCEAAAAEKAVISADTKDPSPSRWALEKYALLQPKSSLRVTLSNLALGGTGLVRLDPSPSPSLNPYPNHNPSSPGFAPDGSAQAYRLGLGLGLLGSGLGLEGSAQCYPFHLVDTMRLARQASTPLWNKVRGRDRGRGGYTCR